MNWEFIVEYLLLYEKATVLTVRIGLLGIAFAILVGFACAMVQYHRIFIYYGLPKVGLQLSPEICGVAGLAFLGGSYMAEAFRSGLESVETIQEKVRSVWE